MTATNSSKPPFEKKLVDFMESFAFFVVIALSMYFTIIIPEIIQFNKKINVTEDPFIYYEILFIFLGAFFAFFLEKISALLFLNYIKTNKIEKSFRKETDDKRNKRLVGYIHDFIYYTAMTAIGYKLIKETELLPAFLGGKTQLPIFSKIWPKNIDWKIRAYFLTSFGHHLLKMGQLIATKRQTSDFFVMNLHHFVTFFLMVASYFMRQLHFGVAVLFIHDIGDPILNVTKFFREIKPLKKYLMPAFIFMYITWFSTRIIFYTVEVLSNLGRLISNPSSEIKEFYNAFLFQIISLYVLGILDYYWVFMTTKIMYDKVVKQKENIVHEGEAEEIKEKKD